MSIIPLGTTGSFTLDVKPEHLASQVKNPALPDVLATPIMILVMENAALNAISRYLKPEERALGTEIDVRHFAATPVGLRVVATAVVTKVDGRRIVFDVTAHDEIEEIGKGTHERTIIDLHRLQQRLDAKSARSAAARKS
ncbi:thioesterase family protein [Nitrobacter sp.]|uniref:thioesterase family protein n=1 Tax=Nitrobacter sp. TaxID=29420 RepID=UPI003F6492F6